jgi:signal transduction histidine kinase
MLPSHGPRWRPSAGGAPHAPQSPAGAGRLCPPAPRLRRYGIALVATGVAILFHYGLHPLMDERAFVLKLVLAILVSAWYGGLGPGLFATGLGALVTLILVVPPSSGLLLPLQEDSVALVLLVGTGSVISLLLAYLHQAHQRAEATHRQLARAAQRAEHFAMLGRVAASVSHDIRNPLGAMMLHVDLLEEELRAPRSDSAEAMTAAVVEIKTQAARLDDLVQDYLSLARVAHLERTALDLGTMVQAWAAESQLAAAARGVAVQLVGMETLGQVALHASTLRRAVLNLVHNALDAMPQGGTLTLAGQGTARQVQLHVRDTGSGIPAAHLAQIFEPLYTTKPEGTGLGLYIAQEIVAAHGGQLTVQSTEGQGTTFTITLPRETENVSWELLQNRSASEANSAWQHQCMSRVRST